MVQKRTNGNFKARGNEASHTDLFCEMSLTVNTVLYM